MSTRFVTNVLLALASGFVIVATQAFSPHIVGWLAFAVTGVVVLAMTAATALLRRRGLVQRTLDAIVAVLAGWAIVESLVFSGSPMVWLSFGTAAAMLAIAVAGLTQHELSTERVVHTLEDVRTSKPRAESIA
jgi:heme exporter protein D